MCEYNSDIFVSGQYVVFQKKDYKKLHLLSDKITCVFIGKDKVDLSEVFGKKIGATFKMVPKLGHSRHFTLQLCNSHDISSARELLKELGSGADNRSICDDGSSQLLTSDSIEELRDSGTAPKAIIEQLVENSKTFQIKTEYSQEKYIKKKEKKYFEFLTVRHPSIRLLAEIFYNRDLPKSVGIRIDTLSQLVTAMNFQPDCKYLLVESGFNGIVSATLLNSLSDEGRLIHITPGNQHQKQAVLAMNFPSSRMSQLMTVRLSTIAEFIEDGTLSCQNNYSLTKNEENNPQPILESDMTGPDLNNRHVEELKIDISNTHENSEQRNDSSLDEYRKRKLSNADLKSPQLALKKPRWAIEADLAVEVLLRKVDGLMIACKEFPSDILSKLLVYVLPSRPFVVYSLYQEPLVALYLQLKQRHDIVYLRITETWLRPYQILPERSHPAVSISSSSGYLLTGIKVVNR